ncbi:MAG: DUF1150 family protein [Alphaproteobacteria bacterium]|nr:DUF1150 family protein [Alphaproteobacteria bacterium]
MGKPHPQGSVALVGTAKQPRHHNSDSAHALRNLTNAEFAALGDDKIVYRRMVFGRDLARLLGHPPQHDAQVPEDMPVHVVFGADGRPLMVTDDVGGVGEWLSEAELTLISRH